MPAASPDRLRDGLFRLAHRGLGIREYALTASRILRRGVAFDGICLLTLDPATMLPTGEVVDGGLPPAAMGRMAEIEIRGEDYNAFAAIAGSKRTAMTLSAATDGQLDRSPRHRELRAPNGFGDELRAVLADDGSAWGALTLLRGDDHHHFDAREADLVATLSGLLAEGVRRATLLANPIGEGDEDEDAGVVLLDADNTVAFADPRSARWLDQLRRDSAEAPVPPAVSSVASRARSIAEGRAPDDALARARARTSAGDWVVVRGTVLGTGTAAQTAVMIERARPHDVAPLVADAYGLTPRERGVTQLVARGLSTDAIGRRLFLSPWTVQDHLKSVFEKVGVTTRGELVARLFFDHRAPRLSDPERDPLG